MTPRMTPEAWALSSDPARGLLIGGIPAVELGRLYGTPLHVLHLEHLERRAEEFLEAAHRVFGTRASVHYAFKCNSLPALLSALHRAGLGAEVMTPFELTLALRAGFAGADIIVNGPCKTRTFLEACLQAEVRYIVIDSLPELRALEALCRERGCAAGILLRVNPDVVPRGISSTSATASRRHAVFGLDLRDGEVDEALRLARSSGTLHVAGYHLHLGTGIRRPEAYRKGLGCLKELLRSAHRAGCDPEVLDLGGGIGSMTSRELSAMELVLSQVFGRSPELGEDRTALRFEDFLAVMAEAIRSHWGEPSRIILEPGRAIASASMLLLLTVHYVKHRHGATRWLITDGGLGTVTMPTYYEYHEILLCNDPHRPTGAPVTITGPGCFAGDIVARSRPMPEVHPGEVLGVMDSGAYFLALESSFDHPRPGVVAVKGGEHWLVRRRETFEDMIARDAFPIPSKVEETV
jgi:diaminopimelate decarboxylase